MGLIDQMAKDLLESGLPHQPLHVADPDERLLVNVFVASSLSGSGDFLIGCVLPVAFSLYDLETGPLLSVDDGLILGIAVYLRGPL